VRLILILKVRIKGVRRFSQVDPVGRVERAGRVARRERREGRRWVGSRLRGLIRGRNILHSHHIGRVKIN